ncbi:hypothetical protein [Bacteroides sp.]
MRTIFLFVFVVWATSLYSQGCDLSENGKKHWLRASIFIEDATSENDYKQAIKELEAIFETDDCADVYYNLGVLYSKLISTQGTKSAEKSKGYFETYLEYKPNEKEQIAEEYIKIDARLEKYYSDIANGIIEDPYKSLKVLEGKWTIAEINAVSGTYWNEAGRKCEIDNFIKCYRHFIGGNIYFLQFHIEHDADNRFHFSIPQLDIYDTIEMEKIESDNSSYRYSEWYSKHVNYLRSIGIYLFLKDNNLKCNFIIDYDNRDPEYPSNGTCRQCVLMLSRN